MPKKKQHRSRGGGGSNKQRKHAEKVAAAAAEAEAAAPAAPAPVQSEAPVRYGSVMGLDNLGNTCFFNSALQMLQSAPQLQMHFGNEQDVWDVPDGPLGAGLRDIFLRTQTAGMEEKASTGRFKTSSHNPKMLLNAVCEIAPQFKGRQQHDSHELLRFMLDGLQTEEEKLSKAKSHILRRASDVEEGIVFRQLSNSHQRGSPFKAIMAELENGMPMESGLGDSSGEGVQVVRDKTEVAEDELPQSDAVFDDLSPKEPTEMADSADVFDSGDEDEEEKKIGGGGGEAESMDPCASDARQAGQRLLRRVLSTPVTASDRASLKKEFLAPALEIAEVSAEQLLRSTLSAAESEQKSGRQLRRVQSAAVRPGGAPLLPIIREDLAAVDDEEASDVDVDGGAAKSCIETLFAGELSSMIDCQGCSYTSASREHFLDLSLPIPWSSATLQRHTSNSSKLQKKVRSPSGIVKGANAKETKRLQKEAKKREKVDRRRAHDSKHETEFELLLTPEQQQQEEVATTGNVEKKTSDEEKANDPVDSAATASDVILLPAPGVEDEDDGCDSDKAEVAEDELLNNLDALVGCDMEENDEEDGGGDPGKLPDWNPYDEEFSIFSSEESTLKVHCGPMPEPKYTDGNASEQQGEESEDEAINLMGCLQSFFKPEDIEWECPQESGKLPSREEEKSNPLDVAPQVGSMHKTPKTGAPKLSRRVSFAGAGCSDSDEEGDGSRRSANAGPTKKSVKWSREAPEVFRVPGSEEQRGTVLAEAIKGNATFNKPFKYSGNDFIVRVRLDAWSGDRLDVLVGPNWDEDAEDVWPDEQKVADVQIDPIEDPTDETALLLLKEQAQVLLDCFSDLFMCQGPHGMLNVLRAGYPDLDERAPKEGGPKRWVVMGRFPPGQIGGAKVWYYPPDSEASAEMFSSMGGESPSPSPRTSVLAPSKAASSELKSSLKRSSGDSLAEELRQLSVTHSPEPHGGVAASPTITHFPPNAAFPGALDDDDSEIIIEAETRHDLAASDFDRSDVGSAQSRGSVLTTLMRTGGSGEERNGDEEVGGSGHVDEEDCAANSKLASALAVGEGANYVRRPRKQPSVEEAKEGGVPEDGVSSSNVACDVDASHSAPVSPPPTSRKGGLRRSVQRAALKKYQIYRAPDLLTVHLKRFQQDVRGRVQKIDGSVPFDFDLDLSPFCDPDGREKDGARYELLGVVVHIGTLRGGHYVAYVRRTAQVLHAQEDERYPAKWFYVSDSFVKQVDRSEVESCEAYMLLYGRVP